MTSMNGKRQNLNAQLPPICRKCGVELTAKKSACNELVVRRSVLDKLAMILTSKDHNNVVVTGKAGVGKTAIVQAFSAEVAEDKYPALSGRRIVSVSLDHLLKDCASFSDRGVRLSNLFKEAGEEQIILFIDEGHRLCGFGESDSLGNAAKPYLTRSDIQVVLATTKEEYRKFIGADPALKRRFEEVTLEEPGPSETEAIMERVMSQRYPEYKAGIEVFEKIYDVGRRFCHDRNNPDKSLSLLDCVVSWMKNRRKGRNEISADDVCGALSVRLDVAETAVKGSLGSFLHSLPMTLSKKLVGWDNEVARLSYVLQESLTRKVRESGPLCSVMLCGEDVMLLEEVAKTSALAMGFAGKTKFKQ